MSEAIVSDKLCSFVERIERLEHEKSELAADIKEVYLEAKAMGFDVKTMRKCVALRKVDEADRREQDELLDLYMGALEGRSVSNDSRQSRSTSTPIVENGSSLVAGRDYDAETGEVREPPAPVVTADRDTLLDDSLKGMERLRGAA